MTELRPKSRLRRFLWIAGSVLLLFTLLGFFVAPPIIKAQLQKRASAALGRTVTVGKVRVNPYVMSVTLEQLDVRLKEGNGSFLGWDRLYVNFDPLASLLGTWTVGAIELEGFHVTAILQSDGSFNFDDILQKLNTGPTSAEPAPLPKLHIGSLKVDRARLDFADQSRKHSFATTFGPVALAVTEFRTVGEQDAPYHFEAVTEAGEKFTWSGTLAANPFRSRGDLAVENINIPKYLAYFGDRVKGEVREGRVSFRGRYDANLSATARVLKLTGGAVQLRGLKLADAPGSEVAVDLPAVDVGGIDADALMLKATVATVAVSGGRLRVQREKDGSLNLITMFDPSATAQADQTAATPATPAATATKLPEFLVRDIAVKDFQVDVSDLAAPRPAQLAVGGLQLSLKEVTLADGAVMPLALAFNWAPQGTVKVDGTVAIKPAVKAELKTDVAALALLPLSPYLEQFLNARITQGALTTTGAATVALAGEVPAITYAGDVTVEKFGLVDGAHNEELAGFGSLALKGLQAATAPKLAVTLEEVNVAAPYARVIVNADKSLNLAAVAKSAPAAAERPAAPAAPAPAAAPADLPDIKIARVVIADGDFTLTDRSLDPVVRMSVAKFGGTISGLSSDNLTRGEVNITALVDGVAPFTLVGKLDPFSANRFVELEFDLKNMELLPLSAYSGKYAGYELARGKLSSNLKVKLDGKQLDATDVITLNQFTFGAPVDSPDATKLPVRLGVALLKDTAGQIIIDVPVSGNIDDPNVRLGKAVIRVIVNLLTKAAVSPFSLLGSLIGGGGEELAFQEFEPGRGVLQPHEIAKLDTVVKMLNHRPALGVAIEGAYDRAADTYALQRLKLAEQVRRTIWEERRAVNPNIPPPAEIAITPEEDVAMVQKLFDAKFPPGTEFGAPLPEKPAVVAAPAAPRKGFLKRVVSTLTLEDLRKKKSTDSQLTEVKQEYHEALAEAAKTGVPLEEMLGRLAQAIEVKDEDLQALAAARAERVRDYFLNEGKIAADRVFLTQSKVKTDENKGPRVFLSPQ